MQRFVWQIEVPVIVILVALVVAVGWYAQQGEQRQQRAADTRAAAISAAAAVERAATDANGSYKGLDGKSAAALSRFGYKGNTRVAIKISATAGTYCLVATDAGLSGSKWRQVTMRPGAKSEQAGADC